jgi:HD-GYP domain-containing protein (c-di-GMP phosphodiesterase class II)
MSQSVFKKLRSDELPVSSEGNCFFDIYIRLPLNNRFVRFVVAGDEVDEQRSLALQRHVDPYFYVNQADYDGWIGSSRINWESQHGSEDLRGSIEHLPVEGPSYSMSPEEGDKSKLLLIKGELKESPLSNRTKNQTMEDEGVSRQSREQLEERFANERSGERFTQEEEKYLREPIRDELLRLYADLRSPDSKGDELDRIEAVTSKLLVTIAPDVESLRSLLAKNSKYIYMVSDAAAITSIAVMFAVAKNFTSRNVFKDLAYSCILMDMGLAELNESDLKQYYVDIEKLSPASKKIALTHPVESYKMLKNRLRTMSDICGQLIVNHHELYNGKGYPRRVRSDILTPLVRVLALSVDVFERMKRSQILGKPAKLRDVVLELRDEKCEPHLRRHGKKLVEEVISFIDSPELAGCF